MSDLMTASQTQKKFISLAEPIQVLGEKTTFLAPHSVAKVVRFDKQTNEVEIVCQTNPRFGLVANLATKQPEIEVGNFVLVQQKAENFFKIKDVSTKKKWQDGKAYTPAFPESVLLRNPEIREYH